MKAIEFVKQLDEWFKDKVRMNKETYKTLRPFRLEEEE